MNADRPSTERAREELIEWATELARVPHHARCSSQLDNGVKACDCYKILNVSYPRAEAVLALASALEDANLRLGTGAAAAGELEDEILHLRSLLDEAESGREQNCAMYRDATTHLAQIGLRIGSLSETLVAVTEELEWYATKYGTHGGVEEKLERAREELAPAAATVDPNDPDGARSLEGDTPE